VSALSSIDGGRYNGIRTSCVGFSMSVDELLNAVDELSEPDLEHVFDRVLWLRARRKAPVLEPEETQLLLEINRGLPTVLLQRYQVLRERREDETLTEAEYEELLQLSDQIEVLGANRLEALAKLADLRQVPLVQLMDDLGIQSANFD
jgi:histidyl-tRNA synthetase